MRFYQIVGTCGLSFILMYISSWLSIKRVTSNDTWFNFLPFYFSLRISVYFLFFLFLILLFYMLSTWCSKYVEKYKNVRDRKREEFIYKISCRYIALFSSNEMWKVVCIVFYYYNFYLLYLMARSYVNHISYNQVENL